MPIDKLSVANFKGVADPCEFDIRPITLFIGPNSSGKSSCIHALAAMAQTVKLASANRAIVLDDEYAQVHLGRFIEVIHSKSYSDVIKIGIAFKGFQVGSMRRGGPPLVEKEDRIEAIYCFKSTKRTQDVFIESATLAAGKKTLTFTRAANQRSYRVQIGGKVVPGKGAAPRGLRFRMPPSPVVKASDEFIEAFFLTETLSDVVLEQLRRTLYLGPFRQPPQRRYPTRGASPAEVGAQGELAITLLANEFVQKKSRPNIKQIGEWLNTIGLARGVEVARMGKSDLFDINITLPDGVALPLADLGYGVSQVLPVLAQCSFAPNGATLLFEQPELHLHPSAARKLATVFVDVVKRKNLSIIAETHSRELFAELFHELRAKRISLADIAAYEVSREGGQSVFKRITIEEDDGHYTVYDPWDKGICQM